MSHKIFHSVVFVALSLNLASCEKHYRTYPVIDLISGSFIAPNGQFPLLMESSLPKSVNRERDVLSKENFFVVADSGDVRISLALIPQNTSNLVEHDSDFGKTLKFSHLDYRMNGNIFDLDIADPHKSSGYLSDKNFYDNEFQTSSDRANAIEQYYFFLDFPEPLTDLNIGAQKVDIKSYDRAVRDKINIHNLSVEFKINNRLHKIVVEYQVFVVKEGYYPAPFGGVSP